MMCKNVGFIYWKIRTCCWPRETFMCFVILGSNKEIWATQLTVLKSMKNSKIFYSCSISLLGFILIDSKYKANCRPRELFGGKVGELLKLSWDWEEGGGGLQVQIKGNNNHHHYWYWWPSTSAGARERGGVRLIYWVTGLARKRYPEVFIKFIRSRSVGLIQRLYNLKTYTCQAYSLVQTSHSIRSSSRGKVLIWN